MKVRARMSNAVNDVPGTTLVEAPPGAWVRVVDLDRMPSRLRESLFSYGLVPGRLVQVIQQAPVTVIQIDNTELALESDLACQIHVEIMEPRDAPVHTRHRWGVNYPR